MSVRYIGIDPGQTGAIAWIDGPTQYGVSDYPGDPSALADIMREVCMGHECVAVVEAQQAMGQGHAQSMMKLGVNLGQWLGMLAMLAVPFRQVRPAEWKKGYVPPKSEKIASLAVARAMFPGAPLARKKDHGRAEALLLADVARKVWG